MIQLSWSSLGGEDALRIRGVPEGSDVRVRLGGQPPRLDLPPMAGRVIRSGGDVFFVPRYAFVEGSGYLVGVDGVGVGTVIRPQPERSATASVLGVYPTAAHVPQNLLRLYLWFSAPMSEGSAAGHVRLAGEDGSALPGALMPTEHELWDRDRRRLTVLLDPARIKRGLVGHEQEGYPLRYGDSIRLIVDAGFRDARGAPLRCGAERQYTVGAAEYRRVDPRGWSVRAPSAGSARALELDFDRPLDHGLLARSLRVLGPDGRPVAGAAESGTEERSWRFAPETAWSTGPHRIVVDPVLEDVAGNSVSRVFDRDLDRPEDDPRGDRSTEIPFQPLWPIPPERERYDERVRR